ncbi:MAG: toprim domain-containing protein, partial [Bacteroidota bacterium]
MSKEKATTDKTKTKTPRRRTRKKTESDSAVNGRSLIIVESPAKAKTINKYLGHDFIVEASVGHIKNLPKSKIGVDIEGGFIPEYETIKGKDDVVRRLRDVAGKVRGVYLATDPDREGEAIAWHIAREIEDVNSSVYRVLFHEITERGITEAMETPSKVNDNLVNSQQARMVMDR